MRERITYFLPSSIPPSDLSISPSGSLSGPETDVALREERLTFALTELPRDLSEVLENNVHELHVRWVSTRGYEGAGPFVARGTPGLGVFWTPREKEGEGNGGEEEKLCDALRGFFGQGVGCGEVSSQRRG